MGGGTTDPETHRRCTPLLALISGLELNATVAFHNNKNGHTATVQETWSQILPISPLSVTPMSISPGGLLAVVQTRVFQACPPAGSPSSYVEWLDTNPPR